MNFPILNVADKWNHIVSGLLWLVLSLSIIFSKFIHVVAGISIAFLFMSEWHLFFELYLHTIECINLRCTAQCLYVYISM